MATLNKVMLIGNLGHDPEIKTSQSGVQIANFSLATQRKQGNETFTDWHRCTAFNRTAEIIGQYCKKGSSLYVEGSVQYCKYQKRDGSEAQATDIIVNAIQFLGSKQDGQQGQQPAQKPYKPAPTLSDREKQINEQMHQNDFPEEDVPF